MSMHMQGDRGVARSDRDGGKGRGRVCLVFCVVFVLLVRLVEVFVVLT